MALIFISRQKFEKEVSQRSAEACDQIITEMGAEVHDDLIQKLSVFRLYIDRLERATHSQDEIENLVITMRSDFEGVIKSVRGISRKLMPVKMEGDSFRSSIEMLCQNMERPGSGRVHFECDGVEHALPSVSQTYLYRIVQELIHNAFRHSAAWHIWVRITWNDDRIILEVEDDGTSVHRISECIDKLRKKHNTLKMRSNAIGASITYDHGQKGLVARVDCPL